MEVAMQEIFDEVREIEIHNNGSTIKLLPTQTGYKLVIDGFKNLLSNARQMPAFGVSLDSETRAAMGEGLWVEFDFGKKILYSQMSFEKLLVQVVSSYSGFNLIRYNADEGYHGRCYYFALNGDMSEFYNSVTSV